jgi:hypothetical protein
MKWTYTMKIHNNPTLPIPLQQLRPHRPLQLLRNLTRRSRLHQLILVLKIHIERQHMPAKQLLAIRRIQPKRLDLALFNLPSALRSPIIG